ncbi:MAG TPA: hypothetical protein VJV03_01010 [Pyrinomonadaceae bacterium]|nr:hypothetical protein [Pyrinomonadaceae bacterium]
MPIQKRAMVAVRSVRQRGSGRSVALRLFADAIDGLADATDYGQVTTDN